MIHRIRSLDVLPDYCLEVHFDNGRTVMYDVKEDMKEIPAYADLMRIEGLFDQVKLDESRTCIVWNENIDLPSDIIYEYGQGLEDSATVAEDSEEYGVD